MKKPAPVTRPDADAAQAALGWALGAGQGEALVRKVEATVKRRRTRRLAAAASAAAVLLLFGAVWQFRSVPAMVPQSASTRITGPARQVLPDGSVIEFKEGARVTVAYEPAVRRVVLMSGEAHFEVAKNKQRPFVVQAGGVEFRAVGTAFSVQLGTAAVELLVTEGRVAVERDAAATRANVGAPTLVDAGSGLSVDLAPTAPVPAALAVSAEERQSRTAWLVPRLEFNATPLAEAIPLFNRYAKDQLILDPSLAALQMSGILRADNTDALLRLLQDEFGIRAEKRSDGIFLRR